MEELVQVRILPYTDRYFRIGKSLQVKDQVEVLLSLIQNLDVFAWNLYEVPMVDLTFITHRLNVDPLIKPKKQKLRRSAKPHVEAVKEEMKKLKQARAIKEVFFAEWLSNTVVVKKKIRKWRVCVDFTDLNQACSKDLFPVTEIDQLVDAIVKHQRMSFLNAFQGYHQISLAPEDQEKTSFITPEGNYHYTVMPWLLKFSKSKSVKQ